VCICIYICKYIYICIYVYTRTHVYTDEYIYIYIYPIAYVHSNVNRRVSATLSLHQGLLSLPEGFLCGAAPPAIEKCVLTYLCWNSDWVWLNFGNPYVSFLWSRIRTYSRCPKQTYTYTHTRIHAHAHIYAHTHIHTHRQKTHYFRLQKTTCECMQKRYRRVCRRTRPSESDAQKERRTHVRTGKDRQIDRQNMREGGAGTVYYSYSIPPNRFTTHILYPQEDATYPLQYL